MKPCPFCGGENLIISEDAISMRHSVFEFYVLCQNCKARGSSSNIKAKAMEAWDGKIDNVCEKTGTLFTEKEEKKHAIA